MRFGCAGRLRQLGAGVLDHPFWRLAARRAARRGDAAVYWPPSLLLPAVAWLWWYAGPELDSWPWPGARWQPILMVMCACAMLPAAFGARGALRDWLAGGQAQELRLTRLAPLKAVVGALLRPALAGLRAGLAVVPLWLVLRLLPTDSAPPPPLLGVLLLMLLLLLLGLHLAAAAGVAMERSRQASIDDWTDFIFNVRTLAAMFLNPGAVLLGLLLLLRLSYEQAGHLGGVRLWFSWPLPPALIFVPVACWSWRQLAGLASELYGETPRLAWQVVAGEALAFAGIALLQVGFGWTPDFARHGLATWWELTPSMASGAQLLLALLLLPSYPLVLFAGYAAALAVGLRGGRHEADQPLPGPLRALAALGLATLGAVAVPWLVYGLCLSLGGWPLDAAGTPFLRRAAQLHLAAACGTSGLLGMLVLTPRLPRGGREFVALAIVLPPLAGPFVPASAGGVAEVLSAWSPLTAMLWLLPDAGTGAGMTGEIPVVAGWQAAVVGQYLVALVAALLIARVVVHPPRHQAERVKPSRPAISSKHPLWSLELLLLRRRGWLLTPLVMLLMPALALGYIRLHAALERMVLDTCWLFVRAGSPGDLDRPPGETAMVVILATVGAQLYLHPPGLAGVRSFGRDRASGRTESWWLTEISTRDVVLGRYLGVCSPFLVFVILTGPPLLAAGLWLGQGALTVAGLAHWLGLVVMLPAVVLAQTVGPTWRGRGLPAVLGAELLRLWACQQLLLFGAEVAMVTTCVAWLFLALWLAHRSLRRCEQLLAADRAGELP